MRGLEERVDACCLLSSELGDETLALHLSFSKEVHALDARDRASSEGASLAAANGPSEGAADGDKDGRVVAVHRKSESAKEDLVEKLDQLGHRRRNVLMRRPDSSA